MIVQFWKSDKENFLVEKNWCEEYLKLEKKILGVESGRKKKKKKKAKYWLFCGSNKFGVLPCENFCFFCFSRKNLFREPFLSFIAKSFYSENLRNTRPVLLLF